MVLSMLFFGGPTLHYFAHRADHRHPVRHLFVGVRGRGHRHVAGRQARRPGQVDAPRTTIRTTRTPGRWCRVECDSAQDDATPPLHADPRQPDGIGSAGAAVLCGAAARGHAGGGPGGRPGRAHAGRRRSPSRPSRCSAASCCRPAARRVADLAARHDRRCCAARSPAACVSAVAPRRAAARRRSRRSAKLSLVDDDTIEHEILSSRLALAMMDRASWEFTDLRSRMNVAREPRGARRQRHPAPARAGAHRHSLVAGGAAHASTPGACCSRCCTRSSSQFAEEAYHETNRWLLAAPACCPRSTCGRSSARTQRRRRAARLRRRAAPTRRRVAHRVLGAAARRPRRRTVGEETR